MPTARWTANTDTFQTCQQLLVSAPKALVLIQAVIALIFDLRIRKKEKENHQIVNILFPADLSLPLPRVCEHTHLRPCLPLFSTPASCALRSRFKVLLLVFKSLNRSSTLDLLGLQYFHPLRSQRSASLVDKQPVTFPPNLKVFLNLDFKYIFTRLLIQHENCIFFLFCITGCLKCVYFIYFTF